MKVLMSSRCRQTVYAVQHGLCRVLQQQGWEVITAGAEGGDNGRKLPPEDSAFERLPVDSRGWNPWRELKLCWAMYQWYLREQPDVVHHFTIKLVICGSLAARFAAVPNIISTITRLEPAFVEERNLLQTLIKGLYRISLPACHTVFFYNTDDMAFFLEQRLVRKEQAQLIAGSGVDTTFFAPVTASQSTALRFLFPARLLKDKGVCEYVAAARWVKKTYPKAQFWLLGVRDAYDSETVSRKELKDWVREEVVKHWDAVEDVRELMGQADVVVFPSHREGLSRVLLEAAAMGKPVIATNVSGCREVVDDGVSGFLVPPKSISSLVEAMIRMLKTDAAQRLRMGEQGRVKIRAEFDESLIIPHILAAYGVTS